MCIRDRYCIHTWSVNAVLIVNHNWSATDIAAYKGLIPHVDNSLILVSRGERVCAIIESHDVLDQDWKELVSWLAHDVSNDVDENCDHDCVSILSSSCQETSFADCTRKYTTYTSINARKNVTITRIIGFSFEVVII